MTLRKYNNYNNHNNKPMCRVGPADEKSTESIYDTIHAKHTFMKDLPAAERPREKLLMQGPAALSNAELLALLLGSGSRSESAVALAERILAADGTGILFLNDCTPEELCLIPGIGHAKACTLIAAAELGRRLMTTPRKKQANVSSPGDIARLFMQSMRHLKKESFKVLLLNVKNEIISIENISTGSLMSSDAHPREVFMAPLRRGAANVILVHNHPSGSSKPSRDDIELTRRLALAGEIMGISVLDHIVIGDGEYTSMKRENLF